jgi:predicted acetyltransferase
MAGLAAVAVAPWARRRGVARHLCEHALKSARERGAVLSTLYPFRPDFYERLGWGFAGELHAYRFRPEHLRAHGGTDVDLATDSELDAVRNCYARVAKGSNGLIDRPEPVWRRILAPADLHVYIRRTADTIDGYMIVRYGRNAPPGERQLWIRELVAESPAAYESLLGWVSLQRDLWRVVRYDATPDEAFAHRLTDPRPPGFRNTRWLWTPVARVIRGPMVRLLDVPKALEARTVWGDDRPVTFDLLIDDPQLPANHGPFRVDFDGSRARVVEGTGAPLVFRSNASVIARVFVGEMLPSIAVRLGLAVCDGDVYALDRVFRSRSFRLLDEF